MLFCSSPGFFNFEFFARQFVISISLVLFTKALFFSFDSVMFS